MLQMGEVPAVFRFVVAQTLAWHSAVSSTGKGTERLPASCERSDVVDVLRLCQVLTATDKTQSSFPGEYPKA